MKPIKIAGFLVVTLTAILLIPYLFSVSSFSIYNYTIRIPGRFFDTIPKTQYKDITRIKTLLTDTTDSTLKKYLPKTIEKDTTVKRKVLVKRLQIKDSIVQAMEFPPDEDTLLNSFFSTLGNLDKSHQLIRILHYGDSQIEGDRITSYFRNQMQRQFGGGGVGLIPVTPINPASISYVFDTSPNWYRYSILNTHKTPDEPEYGVLGCFSRFNNKQTISDKESEAWILLKNPNITYSQASKFNRCKILFSQNRSPLFIQLKKDENIIDADIFPIENNFKIVNWKIETGARNLLISFKGKDSPDLYGISLDSDEGVAVDNIPLRGSSGLEFTRIYSPPNHKVLGKLNVKLIILQFGVNAVINMAGNISRYESAFLRQLKVLRESQPGIPIIVIGVSDISKNTPEGYVTNEAVEKIRDAQKRASFAAGCVFWDMYNGMGGKNSMPSWVFAKPTLAQKDFIHLNALGAKIIGEMFYRSLMNEYNKYISKSQTE